MGDDEAVIGQVFAQEEGVGQGAGDADEEREEGLQRTQDGEVTGQAERALGNGDPGNEEDEGAQI